MTERDELTPDERDALSEDELVDYDLHHVKRDPRVSEDTLRKMIRAHVRRERAQKKQDAADLRLAKQAKTTVVAIRRARAEHEAEEAAAREQERLAAARAAVGGSGVERRKPGRRGWEPATFHAAYREARDRAGGKAALDKEIADAWPMRLENLQRLMRRFGRPT